MKKIILGILLTLTQPLVAQAASGFRFYPSSTTIEGQLAGDGSGLTGVSVPFTGVRYSTDPVSTSLIDLSTVTAQLASLGTSTQTLRSDLTTLALSTAPAVFVSTTLISTTADYYTTSQTTPVNCVTGSTITFNAPAGSVFWIGYNGEAERAGSALEFFMSFLYDGKFYAPLSALVHPQGAEGDGSQEIPFSWKFPVYPTAGAHTACLLLWTTAGTADIPQYGAHIFYAEQIK